jgi:hypothetical protein
LRSARAADAKYFPLLEGLDCSIRQQQPAEAPGIVAVDLGMSEAQNEELNSLGAEAASVDWTEGV